MTAPARPTRRAEPSMEPKTANGVDRAAAARRNAKYSDSPKARESQTWRRFPAETKSDVTRTMIPNPGLKYGTKQSASVAKAKGHRKRRTRSLASRTKFGV